jgi:hypothetical protein
VRALLLALLLVAGCGRGDDDVVVVESPDPDFSAAPGQVIITAKSSPKPSATPPAPASTKPVPPADAHVPFLLGLPQLKTPTGQFVPRVKVELTAGAATVADLSSPDGLGSASKFREIKPGKYLLKITAESAPGIVLAEHPVTVDGERQEIVAFGAVHFSIPEEREHEVASAIQVAIVAEPSKKPIITATLDKLEAKGVVGEKHPLTLLLPFGRYSYILADLSSDPTIGFVNVPEGTPPVLAKNEFDLSEGQPAMVVELRGVIRTK